MTPLTALLFTALFSAPVHAKSWDWFGILAALSGHEDSTELETSSDVLEFLAQDPQGDADRAAIAEFLEDLTAQELHELMEDVREADLLEAFLELVLQTSDGEEVEDGVRLAAERLMESGDNDHLAIVMASTPMDTSETSGTEYGEGHGFIADEEGGSVLFNTQELRRPQDLSQALADALSLADLCRRSQQMGEQCNLAEAPPEPAAIPSSIPQESKPLETTTLTLDVFDDDFDEVIEVEAKSAKREENDSNSYNDHFTWTGGRGGVDFEAPYTLTAEEVFRYESSQSWGGNPKGADVGGAEVTDGKKGTAKKPVLAYDNFSASIAGDFRRVGDSVVMIGDDNTHLRFIGYEAKSFIGGEINKTGVKAAASGSLNAYLARARSYESISLIEGESYGFALKEYAEANIGANAGLGSSLTVGLSGVELSGEAKAFAGADASSWVGGGVSLCNIKVDLRGKGNVSAGIGAKAMGTVTADWSEGKFGVGGEIAATLGLGGGTGANVWIDAQSLVKTPGVVVDCFGNKIEELGELTHMMDVAHATRDTTLWMADQYQEVNATTAMAHSEASIALGGEILTVADTTIDFTMDTVHSTRDTSLAALDWTAGKVDQHVVGDVGDALQIGFGYAENLVVDQIGSAFVSSFSSLKGLFGGCPLKGACN